MFNVGDRVVLSSWFRYHYAYEHSDDIWIIVEIGTDAFLSTDPVYYAYPSRHPAEHEVLAFHFRDLCCLIEL